MPKIKSNVFIKGILSWNFFLIILWKVTSPPTNITALTKSKNRYLRGSDLKEIFIIKITEAHRERITKIRNIFFIIFYNLYICPCILHKFYRNRYIKSLFQMHKL